MHLLNLDKTITHSHANLTRDVTSTRLYTHENYMSNIRGKTKLEKPAELCKLGKGMKR